MGGMTLEFQVRSAAARVLRLPPAGIERDAPLTRYGLDSLSSVELAAALGAIVGREVPDELLVEHSSLAAITAYLEGRGARGGSPLAQMLADSVLPDDVALPAASAGRAILLTGSSGFLGGELLGALLRETEREIICLARSPFLAPPSARVRYVAGDIERPHLGMQASAYDALSREVGQVFHCAAAVDWSLGYESLRTVNVLGTLELLRFSSRGARKAFHYISSLATCYSTRSRRVVAESDPQPVDPAGIHLGYAQSKWVAEALVRAAAARGLKTTIYRPALIGGHSVSGAGNNQDLLARLIKGCIALRAAPDLEWRLDACPVDFVAAAIARLARRMPAVAHLVNPRRAGWLEAVLWMNLRGYPVRAIPYPEWAARVAAVAQDPSHPLHGLRGFLLLRPASEDGSYLPELFAVERLGSIDDTATRAQLSQEGVDCPRLEPRLLETWFEGYRRSGFLPPASRAQPTSTASDLRPLLENVLQQRIVAMREFPIGGDGSILGELASWRAGTTLALRAYALELEGRHSLNVVVKPRLDDGVLLEVAAEVAALCEPALGELFRTHWGSTALAGTANREIALYRHDNAALRRHSPACYGVVECGGARALVLEHVADLALNDVYARWSESQVRTALRGIAAVHRQQDLVAAVDAQPQAAELWSALCEHAQPWITRWAGKAAAAHMLRRAQARAIPSPAGGCLIHHDFNPRNIGLRRAGWRWELCALDWELGTLGSPQRDLAELLCFVLAPDARAEQLARHVEFHRRLLGVEGAAWLQGFSRALDDFAVQRLSLYLLAHRFRPQPYLARVTRTWAHLSMLLRQEAFHATA